MTADYLIAGGGVGGAVLAELLGRAGEKVLVLERSLIAPEWARPEILWPATVETLFSLAPRESWEDRSILEAQGFEIHDGERPVPFLPAGMFAEVGVQPWSADPNRLREALLGLGSFELLRGVEVRDVLKENDCVVGVRAREIKTGTEREFAARWTIGDDGVSSTIREKSGIEIETRRFPLDFLCFTFVWPASLPEACFRVWLNVVEPDSGILAVISAPLPERRGAGAILARPRVFERHDSGERVWERFRDRDLALAEATAGRRFPDDFAHVRRNWGHASRYSVDGAVLIGDAAHPVSPAGGQGANMAVADARTLAEIFLDGSADPAARYERRRRPANARSLGFSRVAALLWSLPDGGDLLPLLWAGLRAARNNQALVRCFVQYLSTAFEEKR